jgi:hypothetical protein
MRPLETLHNNLCFKTLNNFLTRMINDRQMSYECISSNENANKTADEMNFELNIKENDALLSLID